MFFNEGKFQVLISLFNRVNSKRLSKQKLSHFLKYIITQCRLRNILTGWSNQVVIVGEASMLSWFINLSARAFSPRALYLACIITRFSEYESLQIPEQKFCHPSCFVLLYSIMCASEEWNYYEMIQNHPILVMRTLLNVR